MKYYIQDWAGNDKTSYYGEFKSEEDAFDALIEEFIILNDEDLEQQLGEFVILQRGRV